MEDSRRQEEARQRKILKCKEDLAASELELENLPPSELHQDELVSSGFNVRTFAILK